MDDLTRQIQELVDRYEAADPTDLPQPERDELLAAKIEQDVREKGAHQAWADIFEDTGPTTVINLLAKVGDGIKFRSGGQELGSRIIQLARGYYAEWLKAQIEQAAATSNVRQGRKLADLETDSRINARKEDDQ